MSPLDTELRDALRRRAGDVASAVDPLAAIEQRARGIRRRRTTLAVGGAALAVAAVAIAVPLVSDATRHDRSEPRFAVSGTPTPAVTQMQKPANLLDWPLREQQTCGVQYPAGVHALWCGRAPTGDLVIVSQQVPSGASQAHTMVNITPHDGAAAYSLDYGVTKPDAKQVSAVLPGGATPYIVVVGAPTTGQILYAADGAAFTPVDTVEGVAVFARTGPTTPQPDLIEVLDGNGNLDAPMYRGPIDTGPANPDK